LPNTTSLSDVAHMATTMIHTPRLSPIPYLSSSFDDDIHTIHNPNNVDAELLSWALKYDYILCFGISYTEQSSKWFCIPDSSKLPESELINSLMIHTYDIDLQNNLHENRKMDTVKLVDFVSQDLKSLPDYLQAITPFVELSELQEYLNKYAIPVPADFPGQYYVRKAITLKRLYGDDIDIPNQILHL
ncbi:11732_t:CDS:1, partial [Entrophospora sp. SA101]